ncbi:MAG: murein biosynthesis integral membrane protein MurJ [Pseudomonadota bacterium]
MCAKDNPDASTPSAEGDNTAGVTGRGLLRSTSIVSGMTLMSRVLGLVRDIVIARYFGVSVATDAFFTANRIPNMLRRFFAEGAFSQGFVPVMGRYRERHSHTEAKVLIDAVAGTFGLALFVVTLIGVVAAPLLVALVAPGFIGDNGRFDLATLMLRFTFPYLLFVSLTAFAGGILNTFGKFGAPAFTPVILNVVLIAFTIVVAPGLQEPGMALAYGVFFAGLVQLLFQLPFLARIKAIPRPRWRPGHEGVRRIGRLMVPAIFGSSVAQINVLIGGVIASLLGVGKISLLYYSDRLMEFPLGLFGIALATVTLPTLSRQHAAGSTDGFTRTLDWSMKLIVLIATPSAVGLIVLAEPLVATLFYGGEFDGTDVQLTALSLQAFAVGLVGFSFVKILAPAYFAREDTRTPVRVAVVALVVNAVLSVLLAYWLTQIGYAGTHAGLALAVSIAALLNAGLLYRGLRREGIIQPAAGWRMLLFRVVVANVLMSVCLSAITQPVDWWLDASLANRAGSLALLVCVGIVAYFAALFVLGLRLHMLRLSAADP